MNAFLRGAGRKDRLLGVGRAPAAQFQCRGNYDRSSIHSASAIAPSNDLGGAVRFLGTPGCARTGGDHQDIIMSGWGREVTREKARGRTA
jgi:hypothetical protein